MAVVREDSSRGTPEPRRTTGPRWLQPVVAARAARPRCARRPPARRRGPGPDADPRRGRSTVPPGEMRLLRRSTIGVDDRGRRLDVLARLLRLPRMAAQRRGDGRSRLRGAGGAVSRRSTWPPLSLYTLDSAVVIRQLTEATITRAVYSNRQLLERMVEFWADHFHTNVTLGRYPQDVRGSRGLPQAGARHLLPSMLDASAVEPGDADLSEQHAERRRPAAPNQNYARELMELHTLGVDGGYTQQDVVEVARCFTGWRTLRQHRRRPRRHVLLRRHRHDNNSKLVLGVPIAAGGGINDGFNVLQHPRRPPEQRALRLEEAAALAARLQPVAGARGRHRRRVHADRRRRQGARAPHPALRERALGAAALQASVPLHRLGAAGPEREHHHPQHDSQDLPVRHRPRAVRLGAADGYPQ